MVFLPPPLSGMEYNTYRSDDQSSRLFSVDSSDPVSERFFFFFLKKKIFFLNLKWDF